MSDFGFSNRDISISKNIYLLNLDGYLKLISFRKDKYSKDIYTVEELVKNYFNVEEFSLKSFNITRMRKELKFYDRLIHEINNIFPNILTYEWNYSERTKKYINDRSILYPIRQYMYLGYKIDFFWNELELIVEYDEKYHNNPSQKEKDLKRIEEILDDINSKDCNSYNIIRVKEGEEEEGIGKIIGYLIGRILITFRWYNNL